MTLTRLSLSNPVAVAVAVILVAVFGMLSLDRLPVQLTPEVEKPEITISTVWRAAAPEEIEADIIEPQEKVLRGMPGMTELVSKAQRGRGEVTVTFSVGSNLERGLLEVLNRLNRVTRYPDDAEEPVISTIGGQSRPIAWFILKALPGNERDIASYQDYIEEVVQTRFERVSGVALSEVRGGREREVRITFDPYKVASLGIDLPRATKLAAGNKDVSAGSTDVGKRRYTIRFAGRFGASELGNLVVEWREGRPILLRDIASVEVKLVDRTSFVIAKGANAMAVNAHRETGVNVLEVMAGLKLAMAELRDGPLQRAGLSFEQVYDETLYIDRSINMVRNNLVLGVLLAIGVLWWFLRRFVATLIVAVAIPISLVTAFVFLDVTAHTLNVISLAGLALAMGMVLDAAIVVLENIVRLREQGTEEQEASYQGTTQVWTALLASTLTTVAIFLPVVFLKDESGQLFGDLALAITVAIIASLFIAIAVVPTAAMRFLRGMELRDEHKHWWDAICDRIMLLTDDPQRRLKLIAVLIITPLLVTWLLLPRADYLPTGNRNLAFAFIVPPPGVNMDHIEQEMGAVIKQRMEPYLSGEKQPHVKHYFFVARSTGVFLGARAEDEDEIGEVVPLINSILQGFPDTLAFAKRASLFGRLGGGRVIDVNLQARNIEALLHVAQAGFGLIHQSLPGAKVRPFPGLELAEPEIRLIPDERRIAEAGWDRATVANVMRALGDGLYVGDYFDGEERLDIILRAQPWSTPEELAALPLATPNAGILPVGELMQIVRTAGPDQIRRLDRRRTVTLQVTPPPGMSLDETLEVLKQKVHPVMEGLLPEDGAIRYSGAADKLEVALASMGGSFALAILILYLLMSALFRSFKDSVLVLLALPLATIGGVIALQVVNWFSFQPMDLLTMIGFIILLGLVVNNAILLVHQTRSAERHGLGRRDAVAQAVHLRLRPILMSTLTSIFGMLPLLLIPGAGSELYRGLAAVIVGGMLVSTAFTLVLLPALLRLGEQRYALYRE